MCVLVFYYEMVFLILPWHLWEAVTNWWCNHIGGMYHHHHWQNNSLMASFWNEFVIFCFILRAKFCNKFVLFTFLEATLCNLLLSPKNHSPFKSFLHLRPRFHLRSLRWRVFNPHFYPNGSWTCRSPTWSLLTWTVTRP